MNTYYSTPWIAHLHDLVETIAAGGVVQQRYDHQVEVLGHRRPDGTLWIGVSFENDDPDGFGPDGVLLSEHFEHVEDAVKFLSELVYPESERAARTGRW